jgi:hypothetical protein
MKLTKTQLKEMIQAAVKQQLDEAHPHHDRIVALEKIMMENGLSHMEMLEDVLEVLPRDIYIQVLKSLKEKYGYLR